MSARDQDAASAAALGPGGQEARSLLLQCLAVCGLPEQLYDARLTMSERVTNAVMHGKPPVRVDLRCADGMLEIAVIDADADADPALPVVRPERRDCVRTWPRCSTSRPTSASRSRSAIHGCTSKLPVRWRAVAACCSSRPLASRWSAVPLREGGKAVWLQLTVPDSWPPAAHRTCGDDPAAELLASGARAVHRDD